jgi:hypothetical protein
MCSQKALQIRAIRDQFKAFFDLANKTLHISSQYLEKLENHFSNDIPVGAKRLCVSLFIQADRLLASIITLCKRGLDEEAAILIRSILENASYLMYISEKDHEKRAELYQHSRALSEAQAVRKLNSHAPKGEELDETFYLDNEKKAFEYLRGKYGQEKTKDEIKRCALRADNAADRLEGNVKKIFDATYRILYPAASSVGHAEAPLNFIYRDNGEVKFKRCSHGGTTRIYLYSATLLTLMSIDNLSKLLEIEVGEDIEPIVSRLFSLLEKEPGHSRGIG